MVDKLEGGCVLCAGKCRGHSLGHADQWTPEPGSRAATATPANGEQVERGPGLLDDGMCQEHGRWLCSKCLRGHTLVEEGEETATPTEDARERVKVLEEALDYAIEAVGKEADHAMHVTRASRWVVEEIEAKEARFKAARTALGNKETDRHG